VIDAGRDRGEGEKGKAGVIEGGKEGEKGVEKEGGKVRGKEKGRVEKGEKVNGDDVVRVRENGDKNALLWMNGRYKRS
ncbi:hypothetical protein, partial [Bacillus thuringiensis]|uniref:hypothetical protein n=1 Tax=Bacillus thuringiensis TaxID=1428 RepID=UPI0011A0A339